MLKAFCWALSLMIIVVGLCTLIYALSALYWGGVRDDGNGSLHWLAFLGAAVTATGILARRLVLRGPGERPVSRSGFPVVRRSDDI